MAETSGLSSLRRRGRLRGGDPTKIERDRAKALADVAANKDMSTLDKAALTTAFLPIVGDAIGFASDAKHLYKDPSLTNLGFMLAGLVPFVPSGGVSRAALKSTGQLKKLQKMWSSGEHTQEFKSASGSKYKFYPDGTTIRDKSGKLSKDKSTGLQNRSGKTIFLDRDNTIDVGSLFQNPDIDTSIIPKPNEEKIGQVIVNESIGGFKKGQVLHEFPFSTKPIENFTPVEIYDSRSKIGQAGRGIHFGNEITEVINKRGDKTLPENFSKNTLYHGTTADIKTGLKYSKEGVLGEGIYLTPNVKYAETFAEGAGGNILPVKTNIEKPLIVDIKKGQDPSSKVLTELGVKEDKAFEIVEKAFEEKGNITKQISSRARKKGYDAIVLRVDGKVQEILAYNPKAITSIFKKKRGGSVIMRNPYDYNPRGI